MIGKTLGIYISIRFLRVLLAMVLGLGFLIVTIDFIEQLRRSADVEGVSLWTLYAIALLRTPLFLEKAFPFACLFAAMITLTQLNTKMELVVARAAGVSAWQFLLPISIAAALTGLLVATIYNPFSISALQHSENLQAEIIAKKSQRDTGTTEGYWVKQQDASGGSTVINAQLARNGGQTLDNVKMVRFDARGSIVERLDAKLAVHNGNTWQLSDVKRTSIEGVVSMHKSLILETRLTAEELLGTSAKPDAVSFWSLPQVAVSVEKSGTNPKPYLVQYYSLTALPLFFVAMVLIAATVCLKFVRFGQVWRMILGGILGGFVLYTVTSLITALGSNGVVPPIVAAWAPGFVAILFGMSSLLHQEDG